MVRRKRIRKNKPFDWQSKAGPNYRHETPAKPTLKQIKQLAALGQTTIPLTKAEADDQIERLTKRNRIAGRAGHKPLPPAG